AGSHPCLMSPGSFLQNAPTRSSPSPPPPRRPRLRSRFDMATSGRYKFAVDDGDLFPSGPWTGFYNYTGPEDRHRMDLHLTFAQGGIAGEGGDDVGPFLIRGRYDAATRECHWTKTYIGGHDVFYRGFRDTLGIWGTWEIR